MNKPKELVGEIRDESEAASPNGVPGLPNPEGAVAPLRAAQRGDAGSQRDDMLERRFRLLADRWREKTPFASTVLEIATHPAYQQIVGMGPPVVPLILSRLGAEPDHWFWALKAITGEDPVPESARGDLGKMTAAWLKWGRSRGYEC